MFVINKKRIMFIPLMIMLSVFSYTLSLNLNKTEQVITLPVSNKTIVLDAGHGFP